jgi:hypothetical protein
MPREKRNPDGRPGLAGLEFTASAKTYSGVMPGF